MYVANRKDKVDKRFGFVRFGKGVNQSLVLERLNAIWYGSYKLRANVARFERNRSAGREKTSELLNIENSNSLLISNKHEARRRHNISYADITRSPRRKEIEKTSKTIDKPLEWVGFKYTSTEDDRKRLTGCFTGILKEDMLWIDVGYKIQEAGEKNSESITWEENSSSFNQ
ncbi:hypothetical protein ACS0TY_013568 [Phlomoides rotata]